MCALFQCAIADYLLPLIHNCFCNYLSKILFLNKGILFMGSSDKSLPFLAKILRKCSVDVNQSSVPFPHQKV